MIPCISVCRRNADPHAPFSCRTKNRSIVLLSFVLLTGNTCSQAQDVNTNAVTPPRAHVTLNGVELICPDGEQLGGLARLLSIPCMQHADCDFLGKEQRCCRHLCREGVPAPPREPKHDAVLGVGRMCPKEPVPETLPVKRCMQDNDCEGGRRICCPDQKDQQLYCRRAAPIWSQLPLRQAHAPLMSLIAYMQCQAPPPTVLDLFPHPCNRTLDCFPNLCCQEGSGKFCRPPKKSLVALVAQATQRFTRG